MCTVDSTVQGKRNGSQYLNSTYNLYLAIELPICSVAELLIQLLSGFCVMLIVMVHF